MKGKTMIESYNMTEFGRVVRSIRKSLGLTQTDVRERVGISENTMMKMEKGMVIPKYDTLELLSLALKVDLMAIFQRYRYDAGLDTIMAKADEAILNNQQKALEECRDMFYQYLQTGNHRDLINAADLDLLECFLTTVVKYYDRDLKDLERVELIEEIRHCLQRANPDLKWHRLKQSSVNFWEVRLLTLLALLEGNLEHYDTSVYILESIFHKFKAFRSLLITERRVFLIAIFNLSYHYHLTDQWEKAIEVTKEGIAYSRETLDYSLLHGLYYRQGIAQFCLGQEGYLDSLRYAVALLEIHGKKAMAELYRTVTREQYQIQIP